MRRARRVDGVPLANTYTPTSCTTSTLVNTRCLQENLKGQDFLKFDSGPGAHQILLFTTSDMCPHILYILIMLDHL